MIGRVCLVGAGPGDPALITVRGVQLLQTADVVLYDHLANTELLAYAPRAELIYVGKKRSNHAYTQEEIIALLVRLAHEGKTVVRLKGGDPYLFGRGGEEAAALFDSGIEFEVVPGLTAPLGIAAYAGVPLTHRDHSSSVTLITGHHPETTDWAAAAAAPTLVIYMGVHALREIIAKLQDAGKRADTPCIAVRWGTRPDQTTVTGILATIADLVDAAHLLPPATIIIGEVVQLRDKLDWFGRLPLSGQRVIVTRAEEGGRELAALLRVRGAQPISLPVIETVPLEGYSLGGLSNYDWVVFTSVPAVHYTMARLRAQGGDSRWFLGSIAAIGVKTAAALERYGLRPDLQPDEANSEALAAVFASQGMLGSRVLLPRAAEAREVLPAVLRELGAQLDILDTYRNSIPEDAASRIDAYLAAANPAHWITFTSGSTVKNFLAIAGQEALHGVRIASIGPATSDVARRHGLRVDVEAKEASIEALVDAMTK